MRGRAKAPGGVAFSKCRPGISRGGARGGGDAGGAARRLAAPSRCARRWPLALVGVGLGRVLFLVPEAVVETAEQAAVVLGGQPACGPGLDVVALAVLGGFVAIRVRADAVSQFYGPAGPSAEEARAHADVDPVAEAGDGPLEVGRVHPRVAA